MTSDETAQSVNAFFESYRTAFERLDAPAIADHFAYPSHITSDAGEIVLIPTRRRKARWSLAHCALSKYSRSVSQQTGVGRATDGGAAAVA